MVEGMRPSVGCGNGAGHAGSHEVDAGLAAVSRGGRRAEAPPIEAPATIQALDARAWP